VTQLLIAYHSQSGASAALAEAAETGARDCEGLTVVRRRCLDATTRDVLRADGLLLVCAETNGRLSGGAKDFLDRIFYPTIAADKVMPYALLLSAGSDGRGAVADAQRILRGIPFTEATEALILQGRPGEQHWQAARELGEAFATGLDMAIF
jgi:multimeric flavodoxin WrbA